MDPPTLESFLAGPNFTEILPTLPWKDPPIRDGLELYPNYEFYLFFSVIAYIFVVFTVFLYACVWSTVIFFVKPEDRLTEEANAFQRDYKESMKKAKKKEEERKRIAEQVASGIQQAEESAARLWWKAQWKRFRKNTKGKHIEEYLLQIVEFLQLSAFSLIPNVIPWSNWLYPLRFIFRLFFFTPPSILAVAFFQIMWIIYAVLLLIFVGVKIYHVAIYYKKKQAARKAMEQGLEPEPEEEEQKTEEEDLSELPFYRRMPKEFLRNLKDHNWRDQRTGKLIYEFSFMPAAKKAFDMFACIYYVDGSPPTLAVYPDIRCWTPLHFTLVIPSLLLLAIYIPMVLRYLKIVNSFNPDIMFLPRFMIVFYMLQFVMTGVSTLSVWSPFAAAVVVACLITCLLPIFVANVLLQPCIGDNGYINHTRSSLILGASFCAFCAGISVIINDPNNPIAIVIYILFIVPVLLIGLFVSIGYNRFYEWNMMRDLRTVDSESVLKRQLRAASNIGSYALSDENRKKMLQYRIMPVIAELLKTEHVEVQQSLLRAYTNLILNEETRTALSRCDVEGDLMILLGSEDHTVLTRAVRVVWYLCFQLENRELFAHMGIIPLILARFGEHLEDTDDLELQQRLSRILCHMCIRPYQRDQFADHHGVPILVGLKSRDKFVLNNISIILKNLSRNARCKEELMETAALTYLLRLAWHSDPKISANGQDALRFITDTIQRRQLVEAIAKKKKKRVDFLRIGKDSTASLNGSVPGSTKSVGSTASSTKSSQESHEKLMRATAKLKLEAAGMGNRSIADVVLALKTNGKGSRKSLLQPISAVSLPDDKFDSNGSKYKENKESVKTLPAISEKSKRAAGMKGLFTVIEPELPSSSPSAWSDVSQIVHTEGVGSLKVASSRRRRSSINEPAVTKAAANEASKETMVKSTSGTNLATSPPNVSLRRGSISRQNELAPLAPGSKWKTLGSEGGKGMPPTGRKRSDSIASLISNESATTTATDKPEKSPAIRKKKKKEREKRTDSPTQGISEKGSPTSDRKDSSRDLHESSPHKQPLTTGAHRSKGKRKESIE